MHPFAYIITSLSIMTPEEIKQSREDAAKKTHQGFTIICEKCGSKVVIFDNSIQSTPESGAWGSADLICQDCDAKVELIST